MVREMWRCHLSRDPNAVKDSVTLVFRKCVGGWNRKVRGPEVGACLPW